MDGLRLLAVAPVTHPGGAEICLLRLLAELRERGWETRLATPGPGALSDAATAAAIRAGCPTARVVLVGERRAELGGNAREHARRFCTTAHTDRVEALIAPVADRAAT
jgi:hypothetical protein